MRNIASDSSSTDSSSMMRDGKNDNTTISSTVDDDNRKDYIDSDDSLKWEEFFGGSLDIAPSLLDMYDNMVAKNRLGHESKKNSYNNVRKKRLCSQKVQPVKVGGGGFIMPDKKRPASISSTSSSGSSVSSLPRNCLTMETKKVPFLTSIESFEDGLSDDEDDDDMPSKRDVLKGGGQYTPCNTISAPKPSTGRPRYCDPNLSYIERVVMEIVETERTYVADLREIIMGYMQPIKCRCDTRINPDHVSDLFGNIEDIYHFNRKFLEELEVCRLNPVQVSRSFVNHNEGFTIYTDYCTNYPRTVSVLTELMRKPDSAFIFKERQEVLNHTLPLGSYLLKPVQRILKYHLLLENMVKHYEKGKDGTGDIRMALSTMTGIASHINDMKRKHEHAVRVQEIQSLLYGWTGQDLTTYGELVAEGIFRVYRAKGLRHVFLFDKMLLITKKREHGTLSYKTHIMCSNLMLIESIPGDRLSFHVIPFDQPQLWNALQARTIEQKREWSLQLKRVILENYNAVIPAHARQLVMELGQSKEDADGVLEKPNSRRQQLAPEYLEKRKQDRRKSESSILKSGLRLKKGNRKLDLLSPKRARSLARRAPKINDETNSTDDTLKITEESGQKCGAESLQDADSSLEENDANADGRKSEPGYYSSHESLSLTPANCYHDAEDDHRSSSYLSEDNYGDYELLAFPHTKPNVRVLSSEDEDPSGDYITFDYSHNYDSSRDNVCASPTDAEYYKYYSKLANYDNLVHVWTELGTIDVGRLNLDSEFEGGKRPPVRRVQSFTSSVSNIEERDPAFSHTYSMRYSKTANPIMLSRQTSRPQSNANSESVRLLARPPSGFDVNCSPTAPAVWLKKQCDHLAEASNKSGSLPRGFQVSQEDEDPDGVRPRTDSIKSGDARPITIASDRPQKTDFFDDFEHYIKTMPCSLKQRSNRFPVNGEDGLDQQSVGGWTECSDGNSVSTETLNQPDYKIYRRSVSRSSLRSMLANVSSRLASGIRNTLGGSASKVSNDDQSLSCSNISLQSLEINMDPSANASKLSIYRSQKELDATSTISKFSGRHNAKMVYDVAKAYGNMLKHRLRRATETASKFDGKQSPSKTPPEKSPSHTPVHIYRQGSEAIGARIANVNDCDYIMTGASKRTTANKLDDKSSNVRPDSVLSESSNLTSSSTESDRPKLPVKNVAKSKETVDTNMSDVSGDSFYERSFEAIESMLEDEMFRDSAIYSDQEDSGNLHINENVLDDESIDAKVTVHIGDMADVKRVKGNAIRETLEHLKRNTTYQKDLTNEECIAGIKSIKQRQKELEQFKQKSARKCGDDDDDQTASEFTITEECADDDDSTRMKGWVKHVINKFQSDI